MSSKSGRAGGLALMSAAVAALALVTAMPASAAVMELTRTIRIMGVDNASAQDLVGQDLTFKIRYDTNRGQTEGAPIDPVLGGNYSLTNNGGTSLPLLSASYSLGKTTYDAFVPDLSFFNLFYAFPAPANAQFPDPRVSQYVFFDGVRDGRQFNIGLNAELGSGETLPVDFTQPLTRIVKERGSFSFDHGQGQVNLRFNDEGFTPDGTLQIAAVPEPGTWALMIGGFGLAGVALRRRRRVTREQPGQPNMPKLDGRFARGLSLAALTVGVSLAAQPASADVMRFTRTAKIYGVNHASDPTLSAALFGTDFVFTMTYDTSKGDYVVDQVDLEHAGAGKLFSSPTEMPVLSASYSFGGKTYDATGFDKSTLINYLPEPYGLFGVNSITLTGNSASGEQSGVFDLSLVGSTLESNQGTMPLELTQAYSMSVRGQGRFTFSHQGADPLSGTLLLGNDESLDGDGSIVVERVTAAVPEPATWALMIGGFGLAGAALRRRKVAFA